MTDNEQLYSIIGKMYVDFFNTQKVIEILQQNIKEKEQEVLELKKSRIKDE